MKGVYVVWEAGLGAEEGLTLRGSTFRILELPVIFRVDKTSIFCTCSTKFGWGGRKKFQNEGGTSLRLPLLRESDVIVRDARRLDDARISRTSPWSLTREVDQP